jgi:hypothetical protein
LAPGFDSLLTVSGLLVFVGTLALLYRFAIPAAVLFIIDGAAGVGVFWERWSSGTDDHMQLQAVFSGVPPTMDEWGILVTHLPILLLGLTVLSFATWRSGRYHGFRA